MTYLRSTILGLALLAVAGCGLAPHARPAGDGRRAGRPARTAAVPPGRVPATARALPCTLSPRACGFPDATDTGVPAWATLHEVPGQVASGTGWAWVPADHEVQVTGRGATLTGLRIVGTLDVMASDVTVDDVQVATDGGNFAVSLRHTDDVTIKNSTITGQNSAAGRVGVGIDDIFGDSAGTTISDDNISDFKTGIQVSTGRVTGNYIHNPGYLAGDHTNGILDL